MDGVFSKTQFDFIHGGIQFRQLCIVVKQRQLRCPVDQFAQPHAYQSDHHTTVIETVKNAIDSLAQHMVEGRVRNALLHVVRVEVRVTDLQRCVPC